MEKIKLTPNAKKILRELKHADYPQVIFKEDNDDMMLLADYGLITLSKSTGWFAGSYNCQGLTVKGRAYLYANPQLKDPSIWDDKKYWITTAISFIAIILSIIALCK